jgi:hypothetical protein
LHLLLSRAAQRPEGRYRLLYTGYNLDKARLSLLPQEAVLDFHINFMEPLLCSLGSIPIMQSVAWLPDAIRQSPSAQKLLPRTSNGDTTPTLDTLH